MCVFVIGGVVSVSDPLSLFSCFSIDMVCNYFVLCPQTKMVQHIRKKHPEFAQLANTIQAPLATTVISSAPAVITTDAGTAEAVVVRMNVFTYST